MLWEATEWWGRVRRLVPKKDRHVLLSPPALVYRFSQYALARVLHRAGGRPADDLDALDLDLVAAILDLCRTFGKHYFRLRVEGVENVPKTGPVLLVGNHNGALLPTDGFFTALAIHDKQGPDRRMYSLVHDFVFEDPVLRSYAQRLGMLRAGHDSAHNAFARGHCVLVYPGSDFECFRSFRDRGKIVLGGRKGFLELALRERVPIVPVVSAGTHEQLIVLTRGDTLGKLLHAHAWARSEVFPIVLSVPWGLTSGFVPYLPLPAQTTVSFGTPIRWPELGPEAAGDPEVVEHCYREVEQAMQKMLDKLTEGRRFLLGKKNLAPGYTEPARAPSNGVPENPLFFAAQSLLI